MDQFHYLHVKQMFASFFNITHIHVRIVGYVRTYAVKQACFVHLSRRGSLTTRTKSLSMKSSFERKQAPSKTKTLIATQILRDF